MWLFNIDQKLPDENDEKSFICLLRNPEVMLLSELYLYRIVWNENVTPHPPGGGKGGPKDNLNWRYVEG